MLINSFHFFLWILMSFTYFSTHNLLSIVWIFLRKLWPNSYSLIPQCSFICTGVIVGFIACVIMLPLGLQMSSSSICSSIIMNFVLFSFVFNMFLYRQYYSCMFPKQYSNKAQVFCWSNCEQLLTKFLEAFQ